MKWTSKRHTYERPGRQMHSFEVVFCCGHFLISSSNILEHSCKMASISSIEKDSIATTPDSFKDCLLACKISNQEHTNFQKRKVQQAASGNFVRKLLFCKTCSVQYVFLYLWPKFQKNTFEVVHIQYRSFSRKIHIHMEHLLNGCFCYSSFVLNFLNRYF